MSSLQEIISRFSNQSILVVGDVMLDCLSRGRVERISPEAPVPVLSLIDTQETLGGAGNVYMGLKAYDIQTLLLGVCGQDVGGKKLVELAPSLVIDPQRKTTIKTRFFSKNQQILRVDEEEAKAVDGHVLDKIKTEFMKAVERCDLIILSDYNKGVLTPELCQFVISEAIRRGLKVLLDPKGFQYDKYQGAQIITPNLSELHQATLMPVKTDEDVVLAARCLMEKFGFETVVVTRSEHGITIVEHQSQFHLPTHVQHVYDLVGAGDTVIATFGAAIAAGADMAQAAFLANQAAGIVVGKIGTASVSTAELLGVHEDTKITALPDLLKKIDSFKKEGKRIGFTNGCFDLLHEGHIQLLRAAKSRCDALILGLNSDQSIKRLKGPSRPVQHEQSRARILSSLEMVDLVVLFDEDTPFELIRAIKPDLLVKGADYRLENVVGADLVQTYGGEVFLAPLVAGLSTTGLLKSAI